MRQPRSAEMMTIEGFKGLSDMEVDMLWESRGKCRSVPDFWSAGADGECGRIPRNVEKWTQGLDGDKCRML